MELYEQPEKLLRKLISFDTSNPPGYEKDCCLYIKELLISAGIDTYIYALDENRPNLWAEIKAENPDKPPVMLYGHIDVVPAEPSGWKHHPFSGEADNGFIYGRGAADMKSAIAMFICVMLKVKLEGIKLGFDLILLVLSDEEDTGKYGAKFMVLEHAELFKGIGCALGEVGGFSLHMGGRRFYPVMVAEKQCASLRFTFRGKTGHGSGKHTNTAMEKMAKAVAALSQNRLKTHVTSEVSFMVKEIAGSLGGYRGFVLRLLLNPVLTNTVLNILKDNGLLFDNLLHNNINVTIINAGNAVNVIPGTVHAEADLRILPGIGIDTALEEIKEVIRNKAGLSDEDYGIEVVFYDENVYKSDLKYYKAIREALIEADPEGTPIPYVLGAVTDSRLLSKAGVTTYGFVPMRLPESFDYYSQFHATDEHIPADALVFGVDTLILFLTKYCPLV